MKRMNIRRDFTLLSFLPLSTTYKPSLKMIFRLDLGCMYLQYIIGEQTVILHNWGFIFRLYGLIKTSQSQQQYKKPNQIQVMISTKKFP